MAFLPDNYELPTTPGQFLKLDEGEHKLRVLDSAITGYVYWTEETEDGGITKRAPHRVKLGESIPSGEVDPDNMPKSFWAFPIFNYADNRIQTLELTQKTIMKAILGYTKDEDFGDPQGYDLVITRTGKGKEATSYTLIAKPPKPLDSKIVLEFKQLKASGAYDINKMYEGGYPMSKDAPATNSNGDNGVSAQSIADDREQTAEDNDINF